MRRNIRGRQQGRGLGRKLTLRSLKVFARELPYGAEGENRLMDAASEDARHFVRSWLNTLDEERGIDFEDGRCILNKDGGPEIVVSHLGDEPVVHLYCVVMPTVEDTDPAVFKYALALNIYQALTRGGALSFDPENRSIVLTYQHSITGEAVQAGLLLSEFSDTATAIGRHLREFLEEREDDSRTAQDASPGGKDTLILKA